MIMKYPWWNERQKKLADAAKKFADENIPRGEEIMWTKEFPSDILKKVADKGWFGAIIPKEYSGMGVGVTGNCIIAEELSRVCSALNVAYSVTMFGGVEQLLVFGSNEQKGKWLPKIAKGEVLGAVCVTEAGVGSDAAGVETTARHEGDEYVLNGKKRFISNTAVADIYCVYAKTSNRPEDRAKYNHLSAFIVEKGTPGFTVERINELGGWVGLPNGILDFNEVRVPAENRIAAEGDGWKVMMAGFNFERTLYSAGMLGPMREAIRYAVSYSQRRVQFNRRTIDFQHSQFKLADMFSALHTARLLTYHAAHRLDLKETAISEAAMAKLFASEAYEKLMSDAIQLMGGDGWTRFYPVECFMRDTKVNQIGAGTSEVMRMVIRRQELRAMAEDLRLPPRRIHEKLGIPISTTEPSGTSKVNEDTLLEILVEDYRVNPGLHMSRDDIKERLKGIDDEQLDKLLTSLEEKDFVKLYKGRHGTIDLAKATYEGLRKAKPLDYYKWFPEWVEKEYLF